MEPIDSLRPVHVGAVNSRIAERAPAVLDDDSKQQQRV